MAVSPRDPLADLERLRLQLQENVAKLRKALIHWQTWEAEYEGLKEEIEQLPSETTSERLLDATKHDGGDLLTTKEIRELVGKRTHKQISGLLDRRIEYVHRNVESVQKQVDAAVQKLNSANVIGNPDVRNEEGLPMTDIFEELDEDGDVISSHVSHPDQKGSEIGDTLHNLGVNQSKDEANLKPTTPSANLKDCNSLPQPDVATDEQANDQPRKKSVSFAEEVEELPAPEPMDLSGDTSTTSTANSQSNAADLARGSFDPNERVIELDDEDNPVSVIGPIDESPEDAQLRKEMLLYGLNQNQNIVAQLDLEEGDSDNSEMDEEEDHSRAGSETDEENEFGMSMKRSLDEKYVRQMLELEDKLNARMMQNIGPAQNDTMNADDDDGTQMETELVKDAKVLRIRSEKQGPDAAAVDPDASPKEKSVRFAQSVDVAPSKSSASSQLNESTSGPSFGTAPLKEDIIEHKPRLEASSEQAPQPRRPSRFKSARQSHFPPSEPRASPHRTNDTLKVSKSSPLSTEVLERPPTTISSPQTMDPDDLDSENLQREVAKEYYQHKNKIIQKQGGFKPRPPESGEMELDDDDDGDGVPVDENGRKISLFKAARIRRDGLT